MRLLKYYLQVVDRAGRCAILYWARLEMLHLRFHYASALTAAPDEIPRSETSLSRVPPPTIGSEAVVWSHGKLGVSGKWATSQPPARRLLLRSDQGEIVWTLHALEEPATIEIRGQQWHGPGYVECLETTILPWKMPIDQLRWGCAALPDAASVVWLQWVGCEGKRLVLYNGMETEVVRIDDRGLEWRIDGKAARLELKPCVTLRGGSLGVNVVSKIPGLGRLAPTAFLASQEIKWLSHAAFALTEVPAGQCWAIHERVQFEGLQKP